MEENSNPPLANATPPPPSPQRVDTVAQKKKLLVIIGIFLAIIVILALLIFSFSINSKKGKYEKAANDSYKAGDFAAAEKKAKEGLREYPDDTYLLRKVIDSTTSYGNATGREKEALSKAKPYMDKALSLKPNEAETLLSCGYAYEAAGDYEKALELYQKAAQIKPTATTFFHVGHVLSFLNRQREAEQAYQKASKLDPNNPQIGLVTARYLHEQGKDDDALKILLNIGKAIALEKTIRAEAFTDAAIIELEKSDRTRASEFAKQAVAIDGNYSPALGIYGFSLVKTAKDYSTGRSYILRAIEQNGRISLNYMLAGQLLRSVGYKTQAISYQKIGIEKVGDDNTLVGSAAKQKMKAKMYFELAETYAQAGDAGQAVTNMKLAIENNPKYKSVIENAVKSGYFRGIKNNVLFSSFLKK